MKKLLKYAIFFKLALCWVILSSTFFAYIEYVHATTHTVNIRFTDQNRKNFQEVQEYISTFNILFSAAGCAGKVIFGIPAICKNYELFVPINKQHILTYHTSVLSPVYVHFLMDQYKKALEQNYQEHIHTAKCAEFIKKYGQRFQDSLSNKNKRQELWNAMLNDKDFLENPANTLNQEFIMNEYMMVMHANTLKIGETLSTYILHRIYQFITDPINFSMIVMPSYTGDRYAAKGIVFYPDKPQNVLSTSYTWPSGVSGRAIWVIDNLKRKWKHNKDAFEKDTLIFPEDFHYE